MTTAPLPVTRDWYRVGTADANGVVPIDERHVDALARSNIWLIEGREKALLVDTGSGAGPLREAVAGATDKPVVAFAALGYYDHAGGLYQFDERVIHAADAHRIADPRPRSVASDRYVGWAFRAVPRAGYEPAAYAVPPCTPTRTVEDGEEIDIGGRRFEAVHLPGITAGTCGLFERATGILFTGDALSWDRGYVYDGEPADYSDDADKAAFRASLRRMLELPVSRVYPGHFDGFDAVRLREIVEDYLAGRTIPDPPSMPRG